MFTYHTRRDTQMLCPDLGEERLAIAPPMDCEIIQLRVNDSEMHGAGAGGKKRTESNTEIENKTSPKRLGRYVSYWIRAPRMIEVIA